MKILPDYLIEYMPEIEAALEELRLSVLDHAFELLKCLDIDELSSDDIKEKLKLYDLKVENMSDEWLPNGRFYRLYPSIKHHRTRQNTLKSIAQSGGQFEGLWSDEFINKPQYNYKYIQLLRHYQIGSEADGYFYVSGDVIRDKYGNITSSAVQALTSDILMSQALPAGYTYLYLPWPRPHYPSDSDYFYSVHMLDYDRLHYVEDCANYEYKTKGPRNGWTPANDDYTVYNNSSNHGTNVYYSINTCKYGDDAYDENCTNYFTREGECINDTPYMDDSVPASMYYRWDLGTNTPYKTPYWFDYHYMNYMFHVDDESWPIPEHGKYYTDSTRTVMCDDPEDATYYELDDDCKELADSEAVFGTKCYGHYRFNTSTPIRSDNSSFTPYKYENTYSVILDAYTISDEKAAEVLSSILGISIEDAYTLLNEAPCTIYSSTSEKEAIAVFDAIYSWPYPIINPLIKPVTLHIEANKKPNRIIIKSYICDKSDLVNALITAGYSSELATYISDHVPYPLPIRTEDIDDSQAIIDALEAIGCEVAINGKVQCIDEKYSLYDDQEFTLPSGPYKFDDLVSNYSFISSELIHHIKTYRPFWDVNSPIFAMMQASQHSEIHPEEPANASLYYWMKFKQEENIPSVTEDSIYGESFIRDNEPKVSEETFTSYNRPTISQFENLLVGFTLPADNNQGDDETLSSVDFESNPVYLLGETDPIEYDPTLSYGIASAQNSDGDEFTNLSMYLIGDSSSKELFINLNGDTHNILSSVLYRTSNLHKLWFNQAHTNVAINVDAVVDLYNYVGSQYLYDVNNNNVAITYTIIGIYDENDNPISIYDKSVTCYAIEQNGSVKYGICKFSNSSDSQINAAYVVCKVSTSAGSLPLAAQTVTVFRQSDASSYEAELNSSTGTITFNNQTMTISDFYTAGYIIQKYSTTMYYGDESLTVYYDDMDY
jgi:hypothetical protein